MPSASLQQGQLIEVTIADLSDRGEGVGKSAEGVVFVPNTAIGDRALVRLVRVKRNYARGQLHELLDAAPSRQRPPCIVADKCGGCQWQHVTYDAQLQAKQTQVREAIARIGGFPQPPVNPPLSTGEPLGYRNKATYPVRRSPDGGVRAGYYQKGSHKLVNLNQCPVQDDRLDPFLAQVKHDIAARGWSIYDERRHSGEVRHISVRVGRRTGETLLAIVARTENLPGLAEQAQAWLQQFPTLVGVSLNLNGDRTNAIFGTTTRTVAGREYLQEQFAGLTLRLNAETFFQVNTEAAELIWETIAAELSLTGTETAIDAYCGIGTFSLPLARQVRHVCGLERSATALECARDNAHRNGIENVRFYEGAVADLLSPESPLWAEWQGNAAPDLVLLDPPRSGCDRRVLEALARLGCDRLVYVSCKPATLARDLKILGELGYRLTRVQPVDLFPQTAHIEAIAFLQRQVGDTHTEEIRTEQGDAPAEGRVKIETDISKDKDSR